MREEAFWTNNWDQYYDFYEFWENYHANSTSTCEWVCNDAQDCTQDTGLEACAVTFCYDTCNEQNSTCDVTFFYNDLVEIWPCD